MDAVDDSMDSMRKLRFTLISAGFAAPPPPANHGDSGFSNKYESDMNVALGWDPGRVRPEVSGVVTDAEGCATAAPESAGAAAATKAPPKGG